MSWIEAELFEIARMFKHLRSSEGLILGGKNLCCLLHVPTQLVSLTL